MGLDKLNQKLNLSNYSFKKSSSMLSSSETQSLNNSHDQVSAIIQHDNHGIQNSSMNGYNQTLKMNKKTNDDNNKLLSLNNGKKPSSSSSLNYNSNGGNISNYVYSSDKAELSKTIKLNLKVDYNEIVPMNF